MKRALVGGLLALGFCALALLAFPAHADQVYTFPTPDGSCTNNVAGPSILQLYAENNILYVARFDGVVLAMDWADKSVLWQRDFKPAFGPRVAAFDLIGEAGATGLLYVALTDNHEKSAEGRNRVEPVVALDKETGATVWDTTTAWGTTKMAGDPLRLVQDSNYVYVGTLGGYIYKVRKSDGTPIVDSIGRPFAFKGPPHPFGYTSGIWAMAIQGDKIWAALNYGGIPAWAASRPVPPVLDLLETHVNNRIVIMDTDTMAYYNGVDGAVRVFDSEAFDGKIDTQSPRALPSVMSIWPNPLTNNVYMAGRGITSKEDNRTFGVVFRFSKTDTGAANPIDGRRDLLTALAGGNDADINALVLRVPDEANDPPDGAPLDGGIERIVGDNQYLYVTTRVNRTGPDDGDWFPLVGANILRLNLADLSFAGWVRTIYPDPTPEESPVAGPADWGRRLQAFHAIAMYLEPGPTGRLFVGHNCDNQSPYPALQSPAADADSDGNVFQKFGALVAEIPRDDTTPTAVLMYPTGGEVTNGTYPIGFRTDLPQPDNWPTYNAEFYVRDENTPGNDWRRMEGVKINGLSPNDYLVAGNVVMTWNEGGRIQPLPEGTNYRLRMDVRTPTGVLLYSDTGDGTFMIDRTAPTISSTSPVDKFIATTGRLKFDITADDDRSGISMNSSGIFIDGQGWGCLVTKRAPDGHVIGFSLDIDRALRGLDSCGAQGPPQSTPLSDGIHVIRAVVVDKARNFAFRQWTVRVDATIRTPEFTPVTGTWTNNAFSTISGQFFEEVKLKYAYLDGVDVSLQTATAKTDPVTNPLGGRVVFRPTKALTGGDHKLEIWVEDEYGNLGGPFTSTLRVDVTAPLIRSPEPEPEALLNDARTAMSATYVDPVGGSGLLYDSLRIRLDGFDITRLSTLDSSGFLFEPQAPLSGGDHKVDVSIRDVAGNTGVYEWSYTIDLGKPTMDFRIELPAEQKAVKRGDLVQLRLRTTDDSGVKSVGFEVQGLNANLTGVVPALPIHDQSGVWGLDVRVNETRTTAVRVRAAATDNGGQVAIADGTVLIDNTPPLSFMKDIPATVGATVHLEWENSPIDDNSGVAYYMLERRIGNNSWEVLFPRLETTQVDVGYSEAAQTLIRFRVNAVDHAGNRQPGPSNAVEALARGDPFENVFFPDRILTGMLASFTATPAAGFADGETTVLVKLLGPGRLTFEQPLEGRERIYTGAWNLTEVPPGDYVLRFHMVEASGLELVSKSYPVVVHDAEDAAPPTKRDSPAPLGPLLVATLAAVAAFVRRRQ